MTETFIKEFNKTMLHEGRYGHDRFDAGGETYCGISRHFHPTWPGWKIIDLEKLNPGFPENLNGDHQLNNLVRDFYKSFFWDRFAGDLVAEIAPEIAGELFDTSVNMGVHRAVIFLQKALNSLNRNGRTFPEIVEDGVIGPGTLGTLKKYMKTDPPGTLLKVMNIFQGQQYLEYMNRSPVQEKYARGWFSRVTI